MSFVHCYVGSYADEHYGNASKGREVQDVVQEDACDDDHEVAWQQAGERKTSTCHVLWHG